MQQGRWQREIYRALLELLDGPAGLAAFDFDNTLIQNDLGEACLYELIFAAQLHGEKEQFWQEIQLPWVSPAEKQELQQRWQQYWLFATKEAHPTKKRLEGGATELYSHFANLLVKLYLRLCKEDLERAYRWSRYIFAWQKESDMRALSQRVWERELTTPLQSQRLPSGDKIERGLRIYPELKSLIEALLQRDWEIKIVTASPHFLIEPVINHWGLKEEDVIGMELQKERNLFLPEILEPFPCFGGKVAALQRQTARQPALAVGNSVSDIELLTYANSSIFLAQGADNIYIQAERAGLFVQEAFV